MLNRMFSIVSVSLTAFFAFPTAGLAANLCVSASWANIRSGPGTNYEKVWKVYKYMPLKKVAQKGDWLKVQDVDGDINWIHKRLVSSRIDCTVVTATRANLRTGPGTNYSKNRIVPSAERYTSFKVLQSRGNWHKVMEAGGTHAWIHESLIWVD